MVYVFEDTLVSSTNFHKPTLMKRSSSMENLKNICPPKSQDVIMDVSMDVTMDVSMDIAMANMNISPNNSVAAQGKGFKRSPPMKRTNWYQNQGPRKMQKESRVYMRAN